MFATKQSTLYRKKFILYRKMSFSYRKSVFVTLRLFTVKQLFNNKSQVRKAPSPRLGEGILSFESFIHFSLFSGKNRGFLNFWE